MSTKSGKGRYFEYSGIGYLIVRTTTARSAVPISGATVTIRGAEPELSLIFFSLQTDKSGMTEKVALPSPPKGACEVLGKRPYCLYNIDVHADGYHPQSYRGILIFDGITSYHTTDLIPLHASGFEDNPHENPQSAGQEPHRLY